MFFLTACDSEKISNNTYEISEGVEAGNSNFSQGEEKDQQIQIALVMKTLTNPFFIEMEKGARKAEKEFRIKLIVKTASQETSIEQQIQIVENLIEERIDAVVIAPGDSLELVPVLKKAQDAGIIIVNIDNRLNPEFSRKISLKDVPFISVNNEEAAYLSAKYISDQIHHPAQVAILEGIREATNAQNRKEGAVRAFRENEMIDIVAMRTAYWKIDKGYEVTAEIMEKYPQVEAIFAANDMMALGAIHYLQENGREDVLIAGFDALKEAKEAIIKGIMEVSIDQKPFQQGYLGVRYAIDILQGKEVQAEKLIKVKVINRETLE